MTNPTTEERKPDLAKFEKAMRREEFIASLPLLAIVLVMFMHFCWLCYIAPVILMIVYLAKKMVW